MTARFVAAAASLKALFDHACDRGFLQTGAGSSLYRSGRSVWEVRAGGEEKLITARIRRAALPNYGTHFAVGEKMRRVVSDW